jgi:heme/copper-type cytochrome/quinol oxidase subunit 3
MLSASLIKKHTESFIELKLKIIIIHFITAVCSFFHVFFSMFVVCALREENV